jgi:addiction module RelE/StbE family toxin
MKIVWSPTAKRNLDAIWEYVAQDNLDAADSLIARLRSAADQLMDFPYLGRIGRIRGFRELVIAGTPYIVMYRMSPGSVEIARVIHGAQDWPPKS